MKKNMAIYIIASMLVFLWLYAGISKLVEYRTFADQLGKSPFISGFATVIAWGLPVIEILTAIALMSERSLKFGLYASFTLMVLFCVYIVAMLNFSYYIPCSCGGLISRLSWSQHLWFNLAWVVISLSGILLTSIKLKRAEANGQIRQFI